MSDRQDFPSRSLFWVIIDLQLHTKTSCFQTVVLQLNWNHFSLSFCVCARTWKNKWKDEWERRQFGDFCFVMGKSLWTNKDKSLEKKMSFSSYSQTSFGGSYSRLKILGSWGLKWTQYTCPAGKNWAYLMNVDSATVSWPLDRQITFQAEVRISLSGKWILTYIIGSLTKRMVKTETSSSEKQFIQIKTECKLDILLHTVANIMTKNDFWINTEHQTF